MIYKISNDKLNNEIYPTQGTLNSLSIEITWIFSMSIIIDYH